MLMPPMRNKADLRPYLSTTKVDVMTAHKVTRLTMAEPRIAFWLLKPTYCPEQHRREDEDDDHARELEEHGYGHHHHRVRSVPPVA